jgi:hypothetical protein
MCVLLHGHADVRSDGLTNNGILAATVYPAVKLNVETRGFALGLANHAARRHGFSVPTCTFYLQFTECIRRSAYNAAYSLHEDAIAPCFTGSSATAACSA